MSETGRYIEVSIGEDGLARVVSRGYLGNTCEPLLAEVGELLEGVVLTSSWTSDYYESELDVSNTIGSTIQVENFD